VTPEQARVGEIARQHVERHLKARRVLDMDELAELADTRPRLEKEFRLPGDPNPRNKVFFFSIDGTVRGERLTGCLFAGECMVVQAEGFERANAIAKEGLRDTVELALEFWEEQNRLVIASPASAITVDVGGGRAAANPKQPDLATDPKMRAMIEHLIGGKKWRH